MHMSPALFINIYALNICRKQSTLYKKKNVVCRYHPDFPYSVYTSNLDVLITSLS